MRETVTPLDRLQRVCFHTKYAARRSERSLKELTSGWIETYVVEECVFFNVNSLESLQKIIEKKLNAKRVRDLIQKPTGGKVA